MNPTDSQIAFRLRKLRTRYARLDVNNDGCISREDYELMAKKVNEYSKATDERAESCFKAFMYVADAAGFAPGVKIPREEAAKRANNMMLTKSWEERKIMCDNVHNQIFDAIDTNQDGCISLEEFRIYSQVIAPDTPVDDVAKSFNLIDVNRNGEISREEFLEASMEYLHGFEENELSEVFFGPLL